MQKERTMSTGYMVRTALLAAVLCIVGPFALPIGAVPVSLTTLVLYFLVYLLDGKHALISYTVYFLLGLVGLPVFSGFSGGVGKLAGPTGGYLIGFFLMIPCAAGMLKHSGKSRMGQAMGLIFATLIAYVFGVTWFVVSMSCDIYYALTVGVLPFLIGDFLKIALAVWIGPALRKRIRVV